MNSVFIAEEIDYDHNLTIGVYSSLEEAENAIRTYRDDSIKRDCYTSYVDYYVREIPFNKTPTFDSVNYDCKFTKVKVK